MKKQAIIHQLETMRRQLSVLDAQIESVLFSLDDSEEEVTEGCDHPKDSLINLTTMGGPERWECKECGFEYNEAEMEVED
jgi:predicted Zn-ribbon and HTH transcriptional regulator